ncbi:hypothetical protein AB0L44_10005 [Nonomuraea wenchangensis]
MISVLDLRRLALEKERLEPEEAARVEVTIYGVLSSLNVWEASTSAFVL